MIKLAESLFHSHLVYLVKQEHDIYLLNYLILVVVYARKQLCYLFLIFYRKNVYLKYQNQLYDLLLGYFKLLNASIK